MRDIIRATPLASGTFYNYFKSKEEVFQAIQDESALRIRPRLHEERAKAATVEEFISGTFRTFFEFVASDHSNFRTIRRNTDTLRVRMDTPEIIAGFEELREDLEGAIAKGLFPPVDADFLMAAIVGVAFEIAERMVRREMRDPADAAAFATALFMGGVRALPPMTAAKTDSARHEGARLPKQCRRPRCAALRGHDPAGAGTRIRCAFACAPPRSTSPTS